VTVSTPEFTAAEYQERADKVGVWDVNVRSYRLRDKYLCEVDNVSPGATIARAEGETREEAERLALDKASRRLDRTRRHD